MFETVNPGWSTPAWGEFGSWRVHGRHQGIDYYVPRGTPLWASGDGVVEVVAFAAGTFGHFIDIRYSGHRVRVSHMLSVSPLRPGTRVTAYTRIGTVGQTGNAEGIVWQGLIHPHVEVRRLKTNNLVNPRTVLRPFDRTTPTSPAPGTPIEIPTPEPEEDDPMNVKVFFRTGSATPEWMRVAPWIRGARDFERGFEVTTDSATALAWQRIYAKGSNTADNVNRDGYIAIQNAARTAHEAYVRTHRL